MARLNDIPNTLLAGFVLALAIVIPPNSSSASAFRLLYSFCSQPNCSDGEVPDAGLIQDRQGNLYGTTNSGGSSGGGTVFRIAPDGTESVFYNFCSRTNCKDGLGSQGGLVISSHGHLFGTTTCGGTAKTSSNLCAKGCGTVFRLAPDGREKVLYNFQCSSDGQVPIGTLVRDSAGNLYGITSGLGTEYCFYEAVCGTVFKLAPDGTLATLYSFCSKVNCTDGYQPSGGLLMDASGNLYGTTQMGGVCEYGQCGIVFEIKPDGTETVLYNFCSQPNCADGFSPVGGLAMDGAGNLYGATDAGGTNAGGLLFRIAADGTESTLYNFCSQTSCTDGDGPGAGPIIDAAGILYGTTTFGGDPACNSGSGCGAIYRLASDGTETVLHALEASDGAFPYAGLFAGKHSNRGELFGTASGGGVGSCGNFGCGTAFEVGK